MTVCFAPCKWLLFLCFFFLGFNAYSQSLGDPVVKITFGAGSATHAGALPADSGSTSYTYTSADFPNDGSYTIENTTNTPGTWWTTTDHTGNTGGYMMIVNASVSKTDYFYQRTVSGLCGGTTYQFSAWVGNLLKSQDKSPPDIIFSIQTTDGTVLQSFDTGPVALHTDKFTWVQYAFNFNLPANSGTVVIKMTNNANGGAPANDLALDDIFFAPYGSQVSSSFSSSSSSAQTVCAGTGQSVTVNVTSPLATGYLQKLQAFVNNTWTDQSTASSASSFTIASPTTAGTYLYRVVTALAANINSPACVVASNQLTLTVSASPSAAFLAPSTTCLGNAMTFTDQSTAIGSTITSWLWDFGDGQTSTAQNPSHTYTTTGDFNTKLTIVNSAGCSSTSTTQSIHVGGVPVPAFTVSTPDCATKAITIADNSITSEGSIVSWAWDFGDGTTTTQTSSQTFQHTYAAAGTYPVKLTLTSNKGCTSALTKNVVINPLPVVNFGLPEVCLADAFAKFTDSTTIADNSNASFTYAWNFGDANATATNPNTSTQQNPQHKYLQAAIYQVSLTVTSGNGCSITTTKSFTVNGSVPVAAFTVLNPSDLCSNREVFFSNQSTVDFGSITKIEMIYDYVNNPTVIETDNSPYYNKLYRHKYIEFHTGTKNYQVRMMAYSGGTCVAIKDVTITLLPTPNLTFTKQSALCVNGNSVQLSVTDASGLNGSGVYSGTGVSSTGMFNPATAGVGAFPITYIYTANNSCADTVSQTITVNATPTVNAGTDMTVLEGGSAIIPATASGDSLTYAWYPTTYLSDATILNPVVTPAANTTYTLTVSNIKGCAVSSQITVSVLKSPVIPNAFTPNGDGVNDTWNIKYLDTYTGSTVQIYNRYGSVMFSSIGYAIPWDGKYKSGDLPAGVYYYIIDPKHGRKPLTGWVTVIR